MFAATPHPSLNDQILLLSSVGLTLCMLSPSPSPRCNLQVKQTVMTSVYGVTYIGAREQIAGKLQERGFVQEEELRKVGDLHSRQSASLCVQTI